MTYAAVFICGVFFTAFIIFWSFALVIRKGVKKLFARHRVTLRSAEGETQTETGWLIEIEPSHDEIYPRYLRLLWPPLAPLPASSFVFDSDPRNALRFARKSDADLIRQTFTPGNHVRSVEHGFELSSTPISQPPGEEGLLPELPYADAKTAYDIFRGTNRGRTVPHWHELGDWSKSAFAFVFQHANRLSSADLVAAAKAEERERCAKIAENKLGWSEHGDQRARNIAAAIRSAGGE